MAALTSRYGFVLIALMAMLAGCSPPAEPTFADAEKLMNVQIRMLARNTKILGETGIIEEIKEIETLEIQSDKKRIEPDVRHKYNATKNLLELEGEELYLAKIRVVGTYKATYNGPSKGFREEFWMLMHRKDSIRWQGAVLR